MSKIKISKPDRLPREGVTDIDLNTWKNEIINYLNQDDNFDKFTATGPYPTWTAAETDSRRIITHVGPDTNNDINKRRKQLHNFLTIIAGCVYKDHYMTILDQATSLDWIWTELKNIYQIVHVGKDFLNIVDIKYDPDTMSATTIYNAYRSKIMENLKPRDTTIQWKSNLVLTRNESLSPTFEDHILLTVLQLIDSRLPAKIREVYGPRMDNTKFLMDFKQDILCNVTKHIEEIENSDAQVNAIQMNLSASKLNSAATVAFIKPTNRFNKDRRGKFQRNNSNNNSNLKFCRLCHLSQRPRTVVTSHEIGDLSCPSLSGRDKTALQEKSGRLAPLVTAEDDLASLAKLHGYDDGDNEDSYLQDEQVPIISEDSMLNHISPVPSQLLTLFQDDKIVHIDLDSGCWVSCVTLKFAKEMNWTILPNSQLAKLADDKTILKSVGEISETLNRNNWQVQFRALVLEDLHTAAIGGNNFLKDNKIEQSITNRNITVHGKYVVPETNRSVELPAKLNTMIMAVTVPKTLLPQQSVKVKVPLKNNSHIVTEPRTENKIKTWPSPQLCTVINGEITITNEGSVPLQFNKPTHKIQVRNIEEKESMSPNKDYKYKPTNFKSSAEMKTENNDIYKDLTINTDILNKAQEKSLSKLYKHTANFSTKI